MSDPSIKGAKRSSSRPAPHSASQKSSAKGRKVTAKSAKPKPKRAAAETTEGGGLWFQYCRRCHNPDFNFVKSGAIPDLRRANEATHATFEQIVRGGARRTLGMPSFAKDLSSDQVRWIEAYVLEQARQASAGRAASVAAAGH